MSANTSETEKLSFSTKLAFGAGDLGPAICANLILFNILFFFTDTAGLPPALAGSILTVVKIWDAINDPMVGILSDRTKHPWGRRYPWMIYASIPFGVFFILQWIVPSTNQWVLFFYYMAIALLFNTTYTCVNLPYVALTPELTQDYNERTSLNSFRFAFSIGGSIFSLILAQIIFIFIKDNHLKYLVLGSICGVLSVLPIYWCFFGTRDRVLGSPARQNDDRIDDPQPPSNLSIIQQVRIALSNRPFLYVIGIYLCSWLAVQLIGTVLVYFVVSWMEQPLEVFPLVAIAVQGTALTMLFVWSAISKKVGKKAVYFMGISLWIIAQAIMFSLQPGQVAMMYLVAVIAGLGVSTAYLVPWSLIPDVIDLDELNTGERREGIFYSFMVLLQKMGIALAVFLVGIALQIAGYLKAVPGDPPPVQPESALLAIRIAMSPLPAVFLIGGLILAYFYPITKSAHEEILLKLRERKSNQNDGS